MSTPEPCYLVEWYQPAVRRRSLERLADELEASAADVSARGSPVQLMSLVAVPSDEVLFGVFSAGSADLVSTTCQNAGLPANRLSTATDIRLVPST